MTETPLRSVPACIHCAVARQVFAHKERVAAVSKAAYQVMAAAAAITTQLTSTEA